MLRDCSTPRVWHCLVMLWQCAGASVFDVVVCVVVVCLRFMFHGFVSMLCFGVPHLQPALGRTGVLGRKTRDMNAGKTSAMFTGSQLLVIVVFSRLALIVFPVGA